MSAGIGPEAEIKLRMEAGRHVDGPGAGEDEGGEDGGVRVPSHDHLIAGTERGQQEGVIAAGGAVDEKEGAVGAPDTRGQVFRGANGRVMLRGVQPDIRLEDIGAKQRAELGAHADAELVPRR